MSIKNLTFITQDGSILDYHQIDEIWALRNYPIKLLWTFEGDEIVIEDDGRSIFFEVYNDCVIVLYQHSRSNRYKHPKNLIVYNANGTIKHSVEAPSFKSKEMIDGVSNNTPNQSKFKTWIVPPHKNDVKNIWGKIKETIIEQGLMTGLRKKEGKIIITISDSVYFEEQYLEVEKGVFLENAKFGGKY